jgi:site-specific DNA-adenine methylase
VVKGLHLVRSRLSSEPRPFLKWVGGKGQLLSQLLPLLPESWATYHEPFLGGGALFFSLQPARSVLSDVNPALVNVYRMVRDRPDALIVKMHRHVQLSQLHRSNDSPMENSHTWKAFIAECDLQHYQALEKYLNWSVDKCVCLYYDLECVFIRRSMLHRENEVGSDSCFSLLV